MEQQLFIVFNKTDNITASPQEFSSEVADQFIKDFPLRYKAQGYYRTNQNIKINPKDIELIKIPLVRDEQTNDVYWVLPRPTETQ
jgi:hypothetical protein